MTQPVPEVVTIDCPDCHQSMQVPANANSWACPRCRKTRTYRPCSKCGETVATPSMVIRGGGYLCPYCNKMSWVPVSDPPLRTAEQYAKSYIGFENLKKEIRDTRRLDKCTIVGGFNHNLDNGTAVYLTFENENCHIYRSGGGLIANYPFSSIQELKFSGPGKVTNNLGLSGGGFGIEGMIKGVLMAGVVNALTTTTMVKTSVFLSASGTEYLMDCADDSPEVLEVRYSDVMGYIRQTRSRAQEMPKGEAKEDILTQLKGLAELHQVGALTDAEFNAAKTTLLNKLK